LIDCRLIDGLQACFMGYEMAMNGMGKVGL